jgi:valyl-tRNA synthetase
MTFSAYYLGNVIDPLDTISKYGCDSLRFSLVTGSTPGQDVPLSMEKIESNRNFANKLWNVGKYIQNVKSSIDPSHLNEFIVKESMNRAEMSALPLSELYIVSKCHRMLIEVRY